MRFDEWWNTSEPVDMGGTDDSVEEHAVKLWISHPRGKVLEIGCGRGRLISKLATDFPSNSFVGYDPSVSLLGYAPVLKNVRYFSKLPDEKFSFIYSMLVFQHIPDAEKRRYIQWAAEHLEPGCAFRFQYVNEGEQAPRNFPISNALMMTYCQSAGFQLEINSDDKYPQWSWITARLPR